MNKSKYLQMLFLALASRGKYISKPYPLASKNKPKLSHVGERDEKWKDRKKKARMRTRRRKNKRGY